MAEPLSPEGLAALVVWYRQHFPHHCFYCGRVLLTRPRRSPSWPHGRPKPNQRTFDHVLPRSRGGGRLEDSQNQVACCHPCNGKKDNLTIEQFRHRVAGCNWLVDERFFGEHQFERHKEKE